MTTESGVGSRQTLVSFSRPKYQDTGAVPTAEIEACHRLVFGQSLAILGRSLATSAVLNSSSRSSYHPLGKSVIRRLTSIRDRSSELRVPHSVSESQRPRLALLVPSATVNNYPESRANIYCKAQGRRVMASKDVSNGLIEKNQAQFTESCQKRFEDKQVGPQVRPV